MEVLIVASFSSRCNVSSSVCCASMRPSYVSSDCDRFAMTASFSFSFCSSKEGSLPSLPLASIGISFPARTPVCSAAFDDNDDDDDDDDDDDALAAFAKSCARCRSDLSACSLAVCSARTSANTSACTSAAASSCARASDAAAAAAAAASAAAAPSRPASASSLRSLSTTCSERWSGWLRAWS